MRDNGSMDVSTTPPKAKPTPPRARRAGRPRHEANGSDQLSTDRVDERKLLEALTALRKGNFTPRLPIKWTGIAGKVADTFNDVMETNQRMARELERLGCTHAQGYLFSRPLSVRAVEEVLTAGLPLGPKRLERVAAKLGELSSASRVQPVALAM